MHVEAQQGTVTLKLSEDFSPPDLECVVQILAPFAPFSDLIVDFTDAYEFPDLSLPPLLDLVKKIAGGRVAFRGLTLHQRRLLRYLGLLRSERR